MFRVAILLASHNRKETTLKCLDNLFLCELPLGLKMDVYLVDDGSTDGTKELINHSFPEVNVISGDGTLYWNRGMHLAWQTASKFNYDGYIWLNDDTILFRQSLVNFYEAGVLTNFSAIICGIIESSDEPGVVSYGGGFLRKGGFVHNLPNGIIQKCDIINGNVVFVPRSVFEIVGYLDYLFVHAIGDNDYSLRAKKKGIDSYTTQNFVGSCSKNSNSHMWCRSEVPVIKRLKNLYSPLGYSPPYQYFRFELRHFGLGVALKHLFSIHLRVFFPSLWK